MKYTIAVAQIDTQNVLEDNLVKIEKAISEAAMKGASLIAFPETSEYIGRNMRMHATTVPGAVSDFFAECARRYHMYVHCGSLTVKDESNNLPRNMSLLFAPDGKIVASYSKLHMFDIDLEEGTSYKESSGIAAGDEVVVCETELGTFGFSICYDMRFAELFKLQALNGAQILFVPANFTKPTGMAHWEPILRTRAIENTCYVVAPCQCGKKPKFEAFGHSMIIDPWGNILAQAEEAECVILAEIDLDEVAKIRKQLPSLNNRRGDIYKLTTEHLRVYREDAD